jgi:hypothetical protein
MDARRIAEIAMGIAAEICIYTNDRLTIEELEVEPRLPRRSSDDDAAAEAGTPNPESRIPNSGAA